MNKLALTILLSLVVMSGGCGSSSTTNTAPTTASGTWSADLVGGAGAASAISFVTQFTVNANGSLSVTTLTFLTDLAQGDCFPNGGSASGTLNVTTNVNNTVVGTLNFNVASAPAGTTLAMAGTENGNTITGTWTMTGNCLGNGSFTMTQTQSSSTAIRTSRSGMLPTTR